MHKNCVASQSEYKQFRPEFTFGAMTLLIMLAIILVALFISIHTHTRVCVCVCVCVCIEGEIHVYREI